MRLINYFVCGSAKNKIGLWFLAILVFAPPPRGQCDVSLESAPTLYVCTAAVIQWVTVSDIHPATAGSSVIGSNCTALSNSFPLQVFKAVMRFSLRPWLHHFAPGPTAQTVKQVKSYQVPCDCLVSRLWRLVSVVRRAMLPPGSHSSIVWQTW